MPLPLLGKLQAWTLISSLPLTSLNVANYNTLDSVDSGKVYVGRAETARVYELDITTSQNNQKEWDLLPVNPFPRVPPNITQVKAISSEKKTVTLWMNYSRQVPLVSFHAQKNLAIFWKDPQAIVQTHRLAVGPAGQVWLSSGRRFGRFDTVTKTVTYWNLPSNFPPISGLWVPANRDEVWLTFDEGVTVLNKVLFAVFNSRNGNTKTRLLTTFSYLPSTGGWGARAQGIAGLENNRRGPTVWVGQGRSGYGDTTIFEYNTQTRTLNLRPYSHWGRDFVGIKTDKDGNLWTLSTAGAVVAAEKGQTCQSAPFKTNTVHLEDKSTKLTPVDVIINPIIATTKRTNVQKISGVQNGCLFGYQTPVSQFNLEFFITGYFPGKSGSQFTTYFLEAGTPKIYQAY